VLVVGNDGVTVQPATVHCMDGEIVAWVDQCERSKNTSARKKMRSCARSK
jgi:hypothetical protein